MLIRVGCKRSIASSILAHNCRLGFMSISNPIWVCRCFRRICRFCQSHFAVSKRCESGNGVSCVPWRDTTSSKRPLMQNNVFRSAVLNAVLTGLFLYSSAWATVELDQDFYPHEQWNFLGSMSGLTIDPTVAVYQVGSAQTFTVGKAGIPRGHHWLIAFTGQKRAAEATGVVVQIQPASTACEKEQRQSDRYQDRRHW